MARSSRVAEETRRDAQALGLGAFALAAALPWLLFHRVILLTVEAFRLEVTYLLQGWTPWVLILVGLLFLLPVAVSTGRDPYSRWYPRARNAYAGWGLTCYILGMLIGSQVAQVARIYAP